MWVVTTSNVIDFSFLNSFFNLTDMLGIGARKCCLWEMTSLVQHSVIA